MTRSRRAVRVGILTTFALLLSCITINVYFPAAELETAAEEIVEDIYTPDETPAPVSRRQHFPLQLGARAAFAQIDIKVTTPTIRAVRASLEARHAKLLPFYERGALGINRSGYLELRDVAGLSLKDKGMLTKLLQADNKERRTLYVEIMRANHLEPEHQADVERIFAAEWRARARPGWWVQDDAGAWKRTPVPAA